MPLKVCVQLFSPSFFRMLLLSETDPLTSGQEVVFYSNPPPPPTHTKHAICRWMAASRRFSLSSGLSLKCVAVGDAYGEACRINTLSQMITRPSADTLRAFIPASLSVASLRFDI